MFLYVILYRLAGWALLVHECGLFFFQVPSDFAEDKKKVSFDFAKDKSKKPLVDCDLHVC